MKEIEITCKLGAELSADEIDLDLVRNAKVLHMDGHQPQAAIAAAKALAAAAGGGDGVQLVALLDLRVDDFFQLVQVAGAGAPELLLQRDLHHHVGQLLTGSRGKRRFARNILPETHIEPSSLGAFWHL